MKSILRLFSACVFFFLASLISHAQVPSGVFPIEVVNDSDTVTDENIYILIKAQDPVKNGKGVNPAVFVSFDTNGNGSLVLASLSTDTSQFNYQLSDFPLQDGKRVFNIPAIISARVYFSINYPMDFTVITNVDGDITIPDPSSFDPQDPNYPIIYDKVELTYDSSGTFINPTAVDFFSIPIRIQQNVTDPTGLKDSGLTDSRSNIITAVRTLIAANDRTTNKIWANLNQNYTDPQGTASTLRISAPSKAIVTNNTQIQNQFDNTYLNNATTYGFSYIDNLSTFYKANTTIIDTSELMGSFSLSNYIFTGQILTAGNTCPPTAGVLSSDQFCFINGDNTYSVAFELPTTSLPYYAGAGGSFDATNKTPKSIIIRQLTAAFDSGLLPAPSATTLNTAYFTSNTYYQDNTLLPPSASTQGPWYDLYARAIHSFMRPIYAFAYDDALQQDGTLHDTNAASPAPARLTIGSFTGTNIPNPFVDPNTYNVLNLIGSNSNVFFNNTAVADKEVLNNITSPLQVIFNGENCANIYLADGFVRPSFSGSTGILVSLNSTSNPIQANVTYPAVASPAPTPTSDVCASPTPTPTPTPTPSRNPDNPYTEDELSLLQEVMREFGF